MPPAIIGGAIAAAGGLASAAIGSGAAHSAANSAAQASAANNALQEKIYQQNTANETPFMQRGNAAGKALNDLLGLNGPQGDWGSYLQQNPDVQAGWSAMSAADRQQFPTPQDYAQWHYQHYGQGEGRALPGAGSNPAFNQFLDSSGYKFALNQGLQAVNNNMATRGALNSGAALSAINDRAQNVATQNAFLPYVGMLQGQQGVGLSAANALNGVGNNYANGVSSNNNNAASAAGNAAIASGNAMSNGITNTANALGGMFGSSYGGSGINMGQMNNLISSNTDYLTQNAMNTVKSFGY